jgi:ferredoxin-thioredoxin reductase catalytic subunit
MWTGLNKHSAQTPRKTPIIVDVFTFPLPRNGLHNTVILLLLGADDIENTATHVPLYPGLDHITFTRTCHCTLVWTTSRSQERATVPWFGPHHAHKNVPLYPGFDHITLTRTCHCTLVWTTSRSQERATVPWFGPPESSPHPHILLRDTF